MAKVFSEFDRLFKVSFVFRSVGDIFLRLLDLRSIVKEFVYGEADSSSSKSGSSSLDVESFVAESESVLYMYPGILLQNEHLFQEFHNFSLERGKPMATILVTHRKQCRNCGKWKKFWKKFWFWKKIVNQ